MLRLKSGLIRMVVLSAFFACTAVARADETAAPATEPAAHAADHRAPAAGGPLAPLEWLLGEWTGLTDHAVVLVSAHWCDGGAFIKREIIVRAEGQPEVGGTQRIGWDPIKGRIKCWNFDSQGGMGEGNWRRDVDESGSDRWIVESDEVLANGQTSSTTSIFTPQGADRFLWEVEQASVNGEHLPKQQIEFVRADQK